MKDEINYIQTEPLTYDEWMKLPKKEILQLYFNVCKMLTGEKALEQESKEECTCINEYNDDHHPLLVWQCPKCNQSEQTESKCEQESKEPVYKHNIGNTTQFTVEPQDGVKEQSAEVKTERQIAMEVLDCYKEEMADYNNKFIPDYKFNSVALDIINELKAHAQQRRREELIKLVRIARKGSFNTSGVTGASYWKFDIDSENKVIDEYLNPKL